MNQKEVIKKLIEKSWDDPQFKAEFVANPLAVIARETGKRITLPKGKELVVMDQSDASKYYLNLSWRISSYDFSNRELTDSQLEAVAGGHDSTHRGCKEKEGLIGPPPFV